MFQHHTLALETHGCSPDLKLHLAVIDLGEYADNDNDKGIMLIVADGIIYLAAPPGAAPPPQWQWPPPAQLRPQPRLPS